ncbi:MAG: glycosyltransferase family 2 protein [Chloroflexota bacterium]
MPTPEAPRDATPSGTPAGWRVVALVALGGGVALGFLAAGSEDGPWLVGGFAVLVAAGLIPLLWGSRRPPTRVDANDADDAGDLPRVTVLVAGRDEAAVLPGLIADLAHQDHRSADGRPKFDVIVVDDRSMDSTAAAVESAASAHGIGGLVSVIRREGPDLVDGKGAALAAAEPGRATGDVIVVLDADARIDPGFLRIAATYVALGVPALTARRRVIDAEHSVLATIQEDEETQDGELQRGRWASGGCSEFRGNGMVIRRDLLVAVGGFRPGVLTEDLDLSTRMLAQEGISVAWALDLEVREEAVPTWRGLWRQRLRWSEGAIRRFLEFGPAALRSPCMTWRSRMDFFVYGVQLMAPPVIVGALLRSIVDLSPGLAPWLIGIYLLAGGTLAYDALRWTTTPGGSALPGGDRLLRSIRVALFSALWLVAVPGSLLRLGVRRGEARFDKTARIRSRAADAQPVAPDPGASRSTGTLDS